MKLWNFCGVINKLGYFFLIFFYGQGTELEYFLRLLNLKYFFFFLGGGGGYA